MNVITRVAHNRPEMFQLSMEYEIAARKYHMLSGKFHTLFVIEYGAPQKIFDFQPKFAKDVYNIIYKYTILLK